MTNMSAGDVAYRFDLNAPGFFDTFLTTLREGLISHRTDHHGKDPEKIVAGSDLMDELKKNAFGAVDDGYSSPMNPNQAMRILGVDIVEDPSIAPDVVIMVSKNNQTPKQYKFPDKQQMDRSTAPEGSLAVLPGEHQVYVFQEGKWESLGDMVTGVDFGAQADAPFGVVFEDPHRITATKPNISGGGRGGGGFQGFGNVFGKQPSISIPYPANTQVSKEPEEVEDATEKLVAQMTPLEAKVYGLLDQTFDQLKMEIDPDEILLLVKALKKSGMLKPLPVVPNEVREKKAKPIVAKEPEPVMAQNEWDALKDETAKQIAAAFGFKPGNLGLRQGSRAGGKSQLFDATMTDYAEQYVEELKKKFQDNYHQNVVLQGDGVTVNLDPRLNKPDQYKPIRDRTGTIIGFQDLRKSTERSNRNYKQRLEDLQRERDRIQNNIDESQAELAKNGKHLTKQEVYELKMDIMADEARMIKVNDRLAELQVRRIPPGI